MLEFIYHPFVNSLLCAWHSAKFRGTTIAITSSVAMNRKSYANWLLLAYIANTPKGNLWGCLFLCSASSVVETVGVWVLCSRPRSNPPAKSSKAALWVAPPKVLSSLVASVWSNSSLLSHSLISLARIEFTCLLSLAVERG